MFKNSTRDNRFCPFRMIGYSLLLIFEYFKKREMLLECIIQSMINGSAKSSNRKCISCMCFQLLAGVYPVCSDSTLISGFCGHIVVDFDDRHYEKENIFNNGFSDGHHILVF